MALIETGSFPVDEIEVGERLRRVDQSFVEGLAKIIEATGLQHPIDIMRIGNGYRLAAGAHRLAAFKLLGRSHIPAHVSAPETDQPELEIRLREISENIGRRELSAMDRAAHVAELKRVFMELYGDPRGGDRKGEGSKVQTLHFWSMDEDIAAKVGLSRRTVFADIELFSGLSAATRQRLAGHALADNRAQLVALSRLDAGQQQQVLDLLLAAEPQASTVNAALCIIDNKVDPKDPDTEAWAKFLKLWARASKKMRRQIADYVNKGGKNGE